jgi:hypothetical protein
MKKHAGVQVVPITGAMRLEEGLTNENSHHEVVHGAKEQKQTDQRQGEGAGNPRQANIFHRSPGTAQKPGQPMTRKRQGLAERTSISFICLPEFSHGKTPELHSRRVSEKLKISRKLPSRHFARGSTPPYMLWLNSVIISPVARC